MHARARSILNKVLKTLLWIVISLTSALLVIIGIIQLPPVQQRITSEVVARLKQTLGAEVRLERLFISFPKSIVIKGLYMEDQQHDTLAYVGKLSVDTDLWALLSRKVELNHVAISDTRWYIHRQAGDSSFNFDFIAEAFGGGATAVPDTLEDESWTIGLQMLTLEDVSGTFDDSLTGAFFTAAIGSFKTTLDTFSLETLRFHIQDIDLASSTAEFKQTLPAATMPGNETESDLPNISFGHVTLTDVNLAYSDEVSNLQFRLEAGDVGITADKIDLREQVLLLRSVKVNDTRVLARLAPQTFSEGGSAPATGSDGNAQFPPKENDEWSVTVIEAAMANNTFHYDNESYGRQAEGLDFNHLNVRDINLEAQGLKITGTTMTAEVDVLSMAEASGFKIQSFQGKFSVREDSADVSASVATAHSVLNLNAHARYPSIAALTESPDATLVRGEIAGSHVSVQDLLLFSPTLLDSLPLKNPATRQVSFNAIVTGNLDHLIIHRFDLQTLDETVLQSKGTIAGMATRQIPALDLEVQKLYTTRHDVTSILADTLLPDSIELPAWVNANVVFKGTFSRAEIRTTATTDRGTITLAGKMDLDSTSKNSGIKAVWAVENFDVGKLLRQPEYGTLSAKGDAALNGLTPAEMSGNLNATIDAFAYKGFEYNAMDIRAQIEDEIIDAWVSLKEPDVTFVLDGQVNLQDEVPHYNATLDLAHIDFQALNLSQRPLKARGTLHIDMTTADMRVLNGSVGIRRVAIFNGDDLYAVDSLLFASIDQEGRAEINIDSDLVAGKFEGSLNIFEMPAVLREYFHAYYSLHDSVQQSYESPQHFSFQLDIKKTELLTDILLPELEEFTPGEINGIFDSDRQLLNLRINIPYLKYDDVAVNELRFYTSSDSSELNYNLLIDHIFIDSMLVDGLELNGTVAEDSIRANIIVRDSLDYHKYIIGGIFYSRAKAFEFRLDPRQILLNYESWKVPWDNYVSFGTEKPVIQKLNLSHGEQEIAVQSNAAPNDPLIIDFSNLSLDYLTSMVAGKKPVEGVLNGTLRVPFGEAAALTCDLSVEDLVIAQRHWGDATLLAQRDKKSQLAAAFSLLGAGNDIRLEGTFEADENPHMDITAEINSFDLSLIEPLQDQLTNLTGQLKGQLDLHGSPTRPDVEGSLTILNTGFFSTLLQTAFRAENETLTFDKRGVVLNDVELSDAEGHKAKLTGRVNTSDYTDFSLNLDLTTENFQLLKTAAGDNDLFYGLLHLNSYARVRGTATNPQVTMNISLAKGDHLTYVVPQEEAAVLEQQGIVTFVDKSFKADPFIKQIQPELEDTVKSTFRGIDLTAQIELTENETLTVIIDPTTQDQLTVRGNATLTLEIDQTGDMQLAGRYEIKEGTYNFTFYKFVKREFTIQEGSSMTWTGDMLNADMDITAVYRIETSPIELMSSQVTETDALDRFRQRLPFMVYMDITGQLLTPQIGFRLDMPMDKRNAAGGNVYARLLDINTRESDLNKQVFALLILKRFISDNPFENQASSGLEGTARSSVSKILTEQLNQLSENVSGVELSFDVRSYEQYEQGEAEGQTELELGLSKRFLDDRLIIKLSGNVDIEGSDRQQQVTDYIGDISLEYLLTEDGRLRIQGFRNSDYDIIDGELIETGAGLIYIKEYNKLRELFKGNDETRDE